MGQTGFWLALAGGEILAVIFVLLLVAWIVSVRQKGRDRRAINELVSRWAARRDTRKEALKAMLGSNFGLTGAELERIAAELLNAELRLVNVFSQVYLERLADEAAVFDKSVSTSVDAYHKLSGAGSMSAADSADIEPVPAEAAVQETVTDEVVDEGELLALQAENKRLTEELRVTMETMSRMLNEYSTMFASDGTQEVNVVMDVNEQAEAAPDDASGSVADDSDAQPSEEDREAPGNVVEVGQEAAVAGVAEEVADDSTDLPADDEVVDPDDIINQMAPDMSGDTMETEASSATDELPEAGDVDTASAETSASTSSPYDLLDETIDGDEQDPEALLTDLEAAVDDAPVDDIDALIASSQAGVDEEVAATDEADLNGELAELFDQGDEVVEDKAAEVVLDEDLFDLTPDEDVTERKA